MRKPGLVNKGYCLAERRVPLMQERNNGLKQSGYIRRYLCKDTLMKVTVFSAK